MKLAEKLLSLIANIKSEFNPEYSPKDKYHDEKYLTELLASELEFALKEANYDLDKAGEMLAEFISEDIARVCNKEQVLGILEKLTFKEFVEPYLDTATWEGISPLS